MIEIRVTMSTEDSMHLPPLTTTDLREFVESFGLECGLIRLEIGTL